MKLIYKALNITEAHIISGTLQANDIESHVGGYYLQGGVGDLAAMDFATISVADDDVDAALDIIADYEKQARRPVEKHSSKIDFTVPFIFIILSAILMLGLVLSFSQGI